MANQPGLSSLGPDRRRVSIGRLGAPVPSGWVLRVRLVDNGPADGAGTVVSEVTVEDWDGRPLVVELPGPQLDGNSGPATPGGRGPTNLVVFAHLGRSDDIAPGDWITTTAYPVPLGPKAAGDAPVVSVQLQPVT